MTKRQKLFDKWKKNTPTTARRSEVEAILDYYFPDEYNWDGGSHIVVESDILKELREIAPLGILSIPVKNGREVKGVYLKTLMKVIEYIQNQEEKL